MMETMLMVMDAIQIVKFSQAMSAIVWGARDC